MKKSKIKSQFIKGNPVIIIAFVLAVGVLFLRFQSLEPKKEGSRLEFRATLLDGPRVYDRWQYFSVKDYRVKVSSSQVYSYGDILEIKGQLENARLNSPDIKVIGQSTFHRSLFLIRSRLKEKIFKALPQPQASLLAGILLGAREDLPGDFRENLIKTGTIHVVVVSGYNIAVVGGFLASLSIFLNRRLASILAIIGILAYTLLVGADPPAVRAAIMGSLAFFAVLTGKQRFSLYSLILAGFVMLFIQPFILANISFQLSFMATAGIIFSHDTIYAFVKNLPKPINDDLATTLSAQILVIPLIFYHFGSVSLLSPLVNSFILWIVPLATVLGFIFLLVSFVVWPLALLISWVVWSLLSIFVYLVDFFSKFGFAYLNLEPKNHIFLAGYYLVLAAVVYYVKNGRMVKNK